MSILQVNVLYSYLKDILSTRTVRDFDEKTCFADDYTLEEIGAIFDHNGVDASILMKKAALLRWSAVEVEVKV